MHAAVEFFKLSIACFSGGWSTMSVARFNMLLNPHLINVCAIRRNIVEGEEIRTRGELNDIINQVAIANRAAAPF